MIQKGSYLDNSDNSGAKQVQCIDIQGSSLQKSVSLGQVIKVTVKTSRPHAKVKKKQLLPAIIIGVKKEKKRPRGYYIRFDSNRVVMLSEQRKLIGTRIYGPVCKELKIRFNSKDNFYNAAVSCAQGQV